MSQRMLKFVVCTGVLMGLGIFASWTHAQRVPSPKTPGELLPGSSVIYLRADGTHGHEEAYSLTAAYQALHESGLTDIFDQLLDFISEQEGAAGLVGVVQHLREYGVSFAVAVDAPPGKPVQAWATAVVPSGADGVGLMESLVIQLSEEKIEVKARKIKGRQVRYAVLPNPTIELGWWAEGDDLVVTTGLNAIANSLAVAEGDRPNITSHRLWEQYSRIEGDLDVTHLGWFDGETLQDLFSDRTIPLPPKEGQDPLTVGKLLEILGLDTLDHASVLSGYRGDSIWTEAIIKAPGERTGLLSLLDQEPFTIGDLPPIPLSQQGISAVSFNPGRAYEVTRSILQELAVYGPPDALDQLNGGIAQAEETLGFSMQSFLNGFGNLHCVYSDASQGFMGLGGVALLQVSDEEAVLDGLLKLFAKLQEEVDRESPGSLNARLFEHEGRHAIRLSFPRFPIMTPTFSVSGDWLIVGLTPQAVEAQVMRFDERIFSWAIEEDLAETLEMLPEEMTSLYVVNPVATYQTLISFAPTVLGLMELGMKENGALPPDGTLPIDIHSIPPAELVTQSLFTNVAVSTVDENGWQTFARQSLPGIPLTGGAGIPGASAGAGAVLVALLLPAVQQAREAARRAASKNHLKQIALALHNYHDAHGSFPAGTVPNGELEPDERLSWLVSILPYIDQSALYRSIDLKAGWEAESNQRALSTKLELFLNPSQRNQGEGRLGKTNYIGIAGWGEEAPDAPVSSNIAGMFGNNRVTRLRDVVDGSSNTLMVGDSSHTTPWGEGGKATIRAFTTAPYVNGPDGIGSPHSGGAQFVMGDGSVRFISEHISPETLKALSTINGGERTDDF